MPKPKFNLNIDVPEVGQGRGAIVRTPEQIAAEQKAGHVDTRTFEHKDTHAHEPLDPSTQDFQDASIPESEIRFKRGFNLRQMDNDRVKDMQRWAERTFRDRLPTEDKIAEIAITRLYEQWLEDPDAVFSPHEFKARRKKGTL